MPRGDKTGPAGQGPMTGRGMGYCSGYGAPGFTNPGFGFGRGWGRGYGRGFGWRRFWDYYPSSTPTKKEEAEILSEEASALEEELKAVKARLAELNPVRNTKKSA